MLFQVNESMANMQEILFHENAIRFNTISKVIHFNVSQWTNSGQGLGNFSGIGGSSQLLAGNYVCYEAYASVEGLGYAGLWNEDWLKRYFTAILGYQWGLNLSKFERQSLYGGTANLNSKEILAQYKQERDDLRIELQEKWRAPQGIWTG
jgi:hypothetical protein